MLGIVKDQNYQEGFQFESARVGLDSEERMMERWMDTPCVVLSNLYSTMDIALHIHSARSLLVQFTEELTRFEKFRNYVFFGNA